jgi:hypothetical protein
LGKIQNCECEYDGKGKIATNGYVCGRMITLVRKLDGIAFQDESEGFTLELGSHETIRSFALNWPNLERAGNHQILTSDQIISAIRGNKALVWPNENEETYFQRIKSLSQAKTLTITKLTLHYCEGVFGAAPKENESPMFVTAYAELEALADFGNTNAPVRLATPITF